MAFLPDEDIYSSTVRWWTCEFTSVLFYQPEVGTLLAERLNTRVVNHASTSDRRSGFHRIQQTSHQRLTTLPRRDPGFTTKPLPLQPRPLVAKKYPIFLRRAGLIRRGIGRLSSGPESVKSA